MLVVTTTPLAEDAPRDHPLHPRLSWLSDDGAAAAPRVAVGCAAAAW